MIKPKLLTDEELELIRYDVGNTGYRQTQSNVERLLCHITAMQERLCEAIGQRTACRHTIGQLRAILMPGSSSTSHDDLIAAARELVGPAAERDEPRSPPDDGERAQGMSIVTYVLSAIGAALLAAAITWWLL